jgi:DNA-binding transcriptional LysR family regulator
MTTLNLGYLATFRLVQRGSFSAAADVLGLSQPAVSLQIRQLEQFLQTRLVERTGRGIKATAAGETCWRTGSVFSRWWMTPSGP